MTIHAHVAAARQRLRDGGLSSNEAELDARLLAQHVLGWETAQFLSSGSDEEPASFAATYDALIARRAAREPVSYIIGRREFWGLSFDVSPDVLIPRHETELIVEVALELFPSTDDAPAIVDACTGSGIVAIALAVERPNAGIIATDISNTALDVARRNALRHGVADRIAFLCGDLLEPIVKPVDLIVCNPPYVPEVSRPGLQPEVREHEPAVALFGGRDGLQMVARTVGAAPARLHSGGYLVFEFGCGQDVEVEGLVEEQPALDLIELRRDLQGIARTCVVRRR